MRIAALLLLFQLSSAPSRDLSAERCLTVGRTPSERVNPLPEIAPGAPPILSFRYYEGQLHHRYSNSELMLDDAGH